MPKKYKQNERRIKALKALKKKFTTLNRKINKVECWKVENEIYTLKKRIGGER